MKRRGEKCRASMERWHFACSRQKTTLEERVKKPWCGGEHPLKPSKYAVFKCGNQSPKRYPFGFDPESNKMNGWKKAGEAEGD